MARKRSASGRSRAKTIENQLQLQAEKINKRLRSLEKAGNLGKYKTRELMRFAQTNPYVVFKKSKGSKRHRILIKKVKMSIAQARLIKKKFSEVLKSKVFSNIGIKKVRQETRKSLAETLSGQLDKPITDEDLDRFYDIAEYADKVNQESILDKIDPSEFNALVNVAREKRMSLPSWVNMLSEYVQINNDYMKKEAEELYYKYVA